MSQKLYPWSFQIASVSSIPIRIHYTFILFLLYIAFSEISAGADALPEVVFICSVFFCILLHELGHAFAGRLFKLRTRDIVLYPFGGIATMSGGGKPISELVVALAGPAVNIIIAMILTSFLTTPIESEAQQLVLLKSSALVDRLFITNIFLVAFNMIPAFPMDGGRVLRSILSMIFGEKKGTWFSVRIGQILSVLLGILGLTSGNTMLVIIAMFVFINASQEFFAISSSKAVKGRIAGDIMIGIDSLLLFPHGTTIRAALAKAIRSPMNFFPVVFGGNVLGIISKSSLIGYSNSDDEDQYISEVMDRDVLTADVKEPLQDLVGRCLDNRHTPIVVMDEGNIKGMILPDNLVEFLLVYGNRSRQT